MVSVTKIQAGQYAVSDGRFIVKEGSSWYVLKENGDVELGVLPTLAAAKQYVRDGSTPLGQHNKGTSSYSKSQRNKEFNAYLASEAKNGNYLPIIFWFALMLFLTIVLTGIRD